MARIFTENHTSRAISHTLNTIKLQCNEIEQNVREIEHYDISVTKKGLRAFFTVRPKNHHRMESVEIVRWPDVTENRTDRRPSSKMTNVSRAIAA